MEKLKKCKPTILVYGIERIECKEPKEDIETELCILHFESFDTKENFQDYDGVILFQGIFEKIERHGGGYFSESYTTISSYKHELQRRKKQYQLLRERNGFICFLLVTPFFDRDEHGDTSGTDLAKWALNYPSFYRKDIGHQITYLRPMRNEFIAFLKHFGATYTIFENKPEAIRIQRV